MDVMKKAWELARLSQSRFGGKAAHYFKEALKFSWMLEKLPEEPVAFLGGPVAKKVFQVPGTGGSWIIILNGGEVRFLDGGFHFEKYHASTVGDFPRSLLVETSFFDEGGHFLGSTQLWVPKSALLFECHHYLKVKPFIKEALRQPVYLILD